MRDPRRWGISAVLLLGLGGSLALGADREERSRYPKPATESESKWSWMNPANWFGSKEKEKPAASKGKKETKKDAVSPAEAPSPADESRARRNREEADLFRRLAVCDQLREVALRGDDQELLRRAEELSERAFALYAERTNARRPAGGTRLDADLHALDRPSDVDALTRRKPATEPVYNVTTDKGGRRTDGKEVDR
jgi:hypothetical protein